MTVCQTWRTCNNILHSVLHTNKNSTLDSILYSILHWILYPFFTSLYILDMSHFAFHCIPFYIPFYIPLYSSLSGHEFMHHTVKSRSMSFAIRCFLCTLCRVTPTNACDSVSRITRMTRAVERALGVGTVGVSVTVMSVVPMLWSKFISLAFDNIWGNNIN